MRRLYPHNFLTWVKTNADVVSIYIDGDEKDGITVLATVSGSKIKWPLYFLAAGKTLGRNEPTRNIGTAPAEPQPVWLAKE
jgi:hypothetical protein